VNQQHTKKLHGTARCVSEWAYTSGKAYADPFSEIELDVVVTKPDGDQQTVPAFWGGDGLWRVRYTPSVPGRYEMRSVCSDATNPELYDVRSVLEVSPYEGDDPLKVHGAIKVSADGQSFRHEDGTPFFWLGDTWWMGFTRRLRWPDEFQRLTEDRVRKGFSVIQVVAGLYPDMPAYDERGYNEAGHPWEPEYAAIRPAYFDMADLRIQWLVHQGLVPCVVGCWGYHLPWLGIEKIKQHWRYLIARWGAYPVVWCLAGEGAMPYYLSDDKEGDRRRQQEGWTEIARYVRQIDPYGRPMTIHPTDCARNQVVDDSVLDFDMLQTGHGGMDSLPNTTRTVRQEVARRPHMPVVQGEVSYEGILEGSREEVQRAMFWACILSGAGGFTYGANGIWQLNGETEPYGLSPHGASWGDTPWSVAAQLPGSTQVGIGRRILERYPWWRLEPHQEWVEPAAGEDDYRRAYCAGIPGELRIIYFAQYLASWSPPSYVLGIEPNAGYQASFVDPKTGRVRPLGAITPDADGRWRVPLPGPMQDWLLILENRTQS